jgi:nicotinamidase-related amidase
MQKILLVIDMQLTFRTACDSKTISGCKTAIKNSIANRTSIIFVELANSTKEFGPTMPALTDLVRGYDKAFFVKKVSDNGDVEINAKLKELGLVPNYEFQVVGVNAEACICRTVDGLLETNANSTVVVNRNATNGHWSTKNKFDMLRCLRTHQQRMRFEPEFRTSYDNDVDDNNQQWLTSQLFEDRKQDRIIHRNIAKYGPVLGIVEAEKELNQNDFIHNMMLMFSH